MGPEGSGLPLGFGQEQTPLVDAPIYSVKDLNRRVRGLLEDTLGMVWVSGEISNFTHHRSGHMYFTLKDKDAQVDAAMFKMANQHLTFTPEGGQGVLALAQVTVYEPRGRYQIVVQELRPAGVGQLQLAYEKLKAKLQAEGLFEAEHKRPLPPFPQRIGIVTASGAAALRDIASILARRYPVAEILLFPAQVQGEGAWQEVSGAIERANRYSEQMDPIDVLIVGRGGGSLEDLWAFNEEGVARAIAASGIPVVSAVGHEVDVTIADFVADVRAPTPSAAAELVVPDRQELLADVRGRAQQLVRMGIDRCRQAQQRLDWLKRSHGLRRPLQQLQDAGQRLDGEKARLLAVLAGRWGQLEQRHASVLGRLEAANPASLLRRGYSVLRDDAGRMVRQADQAGVGDRMQVTLSQGSLDVRVEGVNDG